LKPHVILPGHVRLFILGEKETPMSRPRVFFAIAIPIMVIALLAANSAAERNRRIRSLELHNRAIVEASARLSWRVHQLEISPVEELANATAAKVDDLEAAVDSIRPAALADGNIIAEPLTGPDGRPLR
jgi:hypothetical protein